MAKFVKEACYSLLACLRLEVSPKGMKVRMPEMWRVPISDMPSPGYEVYWENIKRLAREGLKVNGTWGL